MLKRPEFKKNNEHAIEAFLRTEITTRNWKIPEVQNLDWLVKTLIKTKGACPYRPLERLQCPCSDGINEVDKQGYCLCYIFTHKNFDYRINKFTNFSEKNQTNEKDLKIHNFFTKTEIEQMKEKIIEYTATYAFLTEKIENTPTKTHKVKVLQQQINWRILDEVDNLLRTYIQNVINTTVKDKITNVTEKFIQKFVDQLNVLIEQINFIK